MAADKGAPYDRALKSRKQTHNRKNYNPLFHPGEEEGTLAPAGNLSAKLTNPRIALGEIDHTVALEHAASNARIAPFLYAWPGDCPWDGEKLVLRKIRFTTAHLTDKAAGRRQS